MIVSLFKFANLWPIRLNQWMGSLLGRLAFRLAKKDRGIAQYQLDFCFPELTEQQRAKLLKQYFVNLGKTVFETLVIQKFRKQRSQWIQLVNPEVVAEASQQGGGVILVFAHLGNWELLSVVCEMLNIEGMIVTSEIGAKRTEQFLEAQRSTGGIDLVSRSNKMLPLAIAKSFKKGRFFLAAYDQDINNVPSVFVDFFGRKASTPKNIAVLAQRYQTPVVSAFSQRTEEGRHIYSFELLSEGQYQQGEEETLRLTQHYSDVLEKFIRKDPSQWVWHHRRWKNQPNITAAPAQTEPPNYVIPAKAGNQVNK